MNGLPLPQSFSELTLTKVADEIQAMHPNEAEFLRYMESWLSELKEINKKLKHDSEVRESLILGMEKVLYAIKGSKQ